MVATIRPDDWNWLLLFHLAFAFALVGGLIVVAMVSVAASRRARPEQVPLLRGIAFRTNLFVVLPGFIAVHVLGGLLADREYPHADPDWLSAAFAITDAALIVGGVLLTALQLWVLRRARASSWGGWPEAVATYLPIVVIAALVAVTVLMAGKPS